MLEKNKGFSPEWENVYKKRSQLTSWPWTDLISLVYRYCKDTIEYKNGVVLELGCGAGPNIPFIKSLGMVYYGIEGSKAIVDSLHEKFPELNSQVVAGDFTSIDQFISLPKIDIVIDRAAVTHNDFTSVSQALDCSYAALKSGGYFIGVDWFSTNHDDFSKGKGVSGDKYTRTEIQEGQFANVGKVHFSNEEHLRSLFKKFDIISLEEKIVTNFNLKNNHKFASWNIVARKK